MVADKPDIKKILVPLDGSETSFKTARHALALAKKENAAVMLLHVSQIPPFPKYLKSLDKYQKEVRSRAEEWFSKIMNFPESAGVDIKTRVITAATSIIGTIAEVAENEDIDLIVMGPRGISKFSKLLLGSVTSGVVNHAPCSVLVVK
ncbi:MAG: nucleotide-binding universal stress UspA family protein [Candidatus Nitrosomirales archaeon]|jgi:nucleotide-binding universal stress UspA family protein